MLLHAQCRPPFLFFSSIVLLYAPGARFTAPRYPWITRALDPHASFFTPSTIFFTPMPSARFPVCQVSVRLASSRPLPPVLPQVNPFRCFVSLMFFRKISPVRHRIACQSIVILFSRALLFALQSVCFPLASSHLFFTWVTNR